MNILKLTATMVASAFLLLPSCNHTAISPEMIGPNFSFHAEVSSDTVSEQTTISLCLTEGSNEYVYSIILFLDGQEHSAGMDRVSFQDSPIVTIPLSTINPGPHTLKVTLSGAGKSRTAELQFTEPFRHTELDIFITSEDSRIYISFGENPYDVTVSLTDTLSITGTCTYTVCVNNGVTSKESKTLTLTERTRITSFLPQKDIKYELCDSRKLEDIITGMSEMNWGWRVEWDNLGGGRFLYYPQTQGLSSYQISAESISVDATVNGFSGLTVNVHNSYPNLYWNGTQVTETVYSYKLP